MRDTLGRFIEKFAIEVRGEVRQRPDIGGEVCLHKRSLLPTSPQHIRSSLGTAVRIFEYPRSSLRW